MAESDDRQHWHDVGALAEMPDREVTIITAGGIELGIIRWHQDEVYALHNRCPHQAGPLCLGNLGPRLVCEGTSPSELTIDDERPTMACAWHRWEFDVKSGESLWDPRYKVRTYPVRVEDGRILVRVRARSARR